ncbi:MAG TPA: DNA polymerase Y family protein [Haloferula sp.]
MADVFAALHLPDLPIVAALRVNPAVRLQPCAVLDVDADANAEKVKLPLLAVNDLARRTGIDAGWPLNRALVRCPDLVVLPSLPKTEKTLLNELVGLGESLTPDLEIASRDTLLLDLSRATSRQASRIAFLELEDAFLCHVRASTPDIAHLAVRHSPSHGSTVSLGDVAGMPLALLGCLPGGQRFLPLLGDWGLRRLGDFMGLPRQGLIERLGPEAGRWHDLLHGKTCRLLRLHRPPENMAQEMEFEDAVSSTEPLVFAFKRLLHPLMARLVSRGVAVKEFRLGFFVERGRPLERIVRLPEPRVMEADLLRPVVILLDSLQLGSAVKSISLDVEVAPPSVAQRDWFIRQLPNPDRWVDTLAQLEALLGPGKVGIPVPGRTHRADDFTLWPADGTPLLKVAESPEADETSAQPVPLRRFRPPLEISVAVEAGSQRPLALLSGPYRGQVTQRRGPFLSSGGWWDPSAGWKAVEWDLELGSHLVRIAFVPPDRWEIHGSYK